MRPIAAVRKPSRRVSSIATGKEGRGGDALASTDDTMSRRAAEGGRYWGKAQKGAREGRKEREEEDAPMRRRGIQDLRSRRSAGGRSSVSASPRTERRIEQTNRYSEEVRPVPQPSKPSRARRARRRSSTPEGAALGGPGPRRGPSCTAGRLKNGRACSVAVLWAQRGRKRGRRTLDSGHGLVRCGRVRRRDVA